MRAREYKTISLGGLINTMELSHIVRNADTIFWKRDLTADTIATASMVCRCRIHPDSTLLDALMKRFNAWPPEEGQTLRSVAMRKRFECTTEERDPVAGLVSAMADADVEAYDTHITVDREQYGDVHAYYAQGRDNGAYIFIDKRYHALLRKDYEPKIVALKTEKSSPLLFVGAEDEFLIVLPIVMNTPAFLKAV